MELSYTLAISFMLGITIGAITTNIYWTKKSQKSKGDRSPNIMGDGNKTNV